ncbi:helix-turn-helix domain-containing protein [Lentzea sp. JNUCC 0626]|uniref:helix-turn-helix domain-containing protein n=1 Tax=Lentzea sp. JNUCC 0626 TaxID=3367513 RepID=UPI00374A960D
MAGLIEFGYVAHEQYSDELSEPAFGVSFYGDGDLIGLEEALLPGGSGLPVGAEYRVQGGPVTVQTMPLQAFRAFVVEVAPLAVMEEQAVRAKKARVDSARAGMVVRDRLGTFLIDLALRFGYRFGDGQVELGIPLSQEQIARAIGVSRPAVELEVRWLRTNGYLRTGYRTNVLTSAFMKGGPNGTWCS